MDFYVNINGNMEGGISVGLPVSQQLVKNSAHAALYLKK